MASCCRALWCCCFGCCYRLEDSGGDGGSDDSEADRTRQTDDAAQGSSASNSFTDIDFADGMEKGAAGPGTSAAAADKAAVVSAPLTSATPPRASRKSMAAEYATPHHKIRQGRPSLLAPTRPARPGRKAATTDRYTSGGGGGGRGKRAAKLTAKSSAAAAAAAGVRRQRALVGRVRTDGRRRVREERGFVFLMRACGVER